jgi:acetyl-CoA carboxylase biotin carboxyl carrier protein
MNQKKWRLIDDDVVIGLINDFKTTERPNEVMEEGMCLTSKAIGRSSVIEHSIPVLDLANKTALPKTLQLNQELALDSKDIKEIKAIIDLMKKHDLSVFEIEKEGFRLKLQRGASAAQATSAVLAAAAAGPAKAAVAGTEPPPAAKAIESVPMKEIVSPMVGTFYRAASPDAPAFVEVGKPVTEDTVVCIIEAMKVMNEIKAETSGVIAEVLADNGKPVQFGQALFRVR